MKLLYDITNGKIYYVVYDRDWFHFVHSTHLPLTEFDVDEVDPENKETCKDLEKTVTKVDDAGDSKYYISGGELHDKDGWEEYHEDLI